MAPLSPLRSASALGKRGEFALESTERTVCVAPCELCLQVSQQDALVFEERQGALGEVGVAAQAGLEWLGAGVPDQQRPLDEYQLLPVQQMHLELL